MQKIIFIFITLFFCVNLLSAQVNFEYQFSFDKLNITDHFETMQLYDYDNNGIQDLAVQYWDNSRDNWKIVIYDQIGDTLKTQYINNIESSKFHLFKKDGEDYLCIAGSYDGQFGFVIQDFETLLIIDSTGTDDIGFMCINTVDQYLSSDFIQFLVGYNYLSLDATDDYMCRLTLENDTLVFHEVLSDCGLANTSINDSTILAVGQHTACYPPTGGMNGYTLQKLVLEQSSYELHSTSGTKYYIDPIIDYNHYPENYEIITQNCMDDFPHVLQYIELDTDDGDSVHFKAYDTNNWQNIWSKTDTEIGMGNITASTCIEANGEDNYVMYFCGNKLEIRDRITGNIIHHQDSVLAVCDILRKSDGELLFFVEKQNGAGYDVYSLDGSIFVSADEPHAQNEVIIENYPNPFHSSTTLSYSSKYPIQNAEIKIFNIKGQLVRVLHTVSSSPRRPVSVTWDGTDEYGNKVSSGLYFYQVKNGDEIIGTNKCLLIKD